MDTPPDTRPDDRPDIPPEQQVEPERRAERRGCLPIVAGVLLVLVGLPMLVCPGPGAAVIASGFGMIAVGLGIKWKSEKG
jgi:hypothetical protein